MLEEEEAVDYGEEELEVPTHAQDEVQLMLDGDETPADTDTHATPIDDTKSPTPVAVEVAPEPSKDERVADAKEPPTSERPVASSGKSENRSNGDGNNRDIGSRRESPKEGLPAGWRAITSRSGDGEVYYYNERTGESSWQKPGDARTQPSAPTSKSKKKKKSKNKRLREAAQAAQTAQTAQARNSKPDAKVASTDAKDAAAQGLSIKGAAQRKAEPSQPNPDAGKNAKRKREERTDVGSKPKANESKSNGGAKASMEAKRPRADDRRDVRKEERREARSDDVRRTGDSWRPSTDNSARSRHDHRARDESRRPDPRDNRRDTRDTRDRDHARHDRDRDHVSSQRNASSINSTHAQHKRQWGTVSSK